MTAPIATLAGAAPAAASGASGVRQAAEGFEGLFMSMLVEEMMKSTDVAEANPLYSGLMTEKLGDQLAQAGGIGLADMLERQLGGTASGGGTT
jgi:Rod binding domain-containing protein